MKKKKFDANLNDLKSHPPNEFSHMLPYYKIKISTFCTKSSIINSCLLLFILYTLGVSFTLSKCMFLIYVHLSDNKVNILFFYCYTF